MWRLCHGFTYALLCLFLFCQWNIIDHVDASLISTWSPSCVTLNGVTHTYPESFWRQLTSSMPRRKNVLDNVSLTLNSQAVNLLLGESAAGKSTILRLIMGTEIPTLGKVDISNSDNNLTVSRPVTLDSKPSYRQDEVVRIIWSKARGSTMANSDKVSTRNELQSLSEVLGVRLESKIMDLSMSEVYLCRLGEACITSTLVTSTDPLDMDIEARASQTTSPAPILLLDEWLDTETSTVIQRVQGALEELARNGAVVVCVTHKPQLFRNGMLRRITLSRGKVLSIAD